MRLYIHLTDGRPAPSEDIDELILERAQHLEHFFDRIQTCRVTLASRQRGNFEVHIALTVPTRRELAVSHQHAGELHAAVHAAFDALERQIATYVRTLRREGRMGARKRGIAREA